MNAASLGLDTEASTQSHNMLTDIFVVPPFSVLDTRQGYWQQRRRAWLALGITSELGRGGLAAGALAGGVTQSFDTAQAKTRAAASPWHGGKTEVSQAMAMTGSAGASRREADARSNLTGTADLPDYADFGMASVAPGTSIFDPVLCELIYRWFSPPGGAVLDPFAGGSVRGVVAERLGRRYTGIDLSARQLASNREQAERIGVAPEWICGDSTLLREHVAGRQYDLVFTCPPYYDLEVYSNDPRDLSAQGSYAEFLDLHALVIARAAEHLRPGRFMVYIVSEVRGKDGHYLGFVPDTISAARTAGLTLYNEAVLINPAGTLPMRVTKQFNSGRKLGRMHQNVLVFAKGNPPAREWGMALDDAPAAVTAAGFFDDLPDLPAPADTLDDWF